MQPNFRTWMDFRGQNQKFTKIFDLSFHCTSDGGFRPLTNILVSFITAALSDELKRDENTFQKSWKFLIAIFLV